MKKQSKLREAAWEYYERDDYFDVEDAFIDGARWLAQQLLKDAKAQKVAPEFLKGRIDLAIKGEK
jgi:hypothetical protein